MEDDLNFKVIGRQPHLLVNESQPQLLAPASAELGTAQPQLVLFFFQESHRTLIENELHPVGSRLRECMFSQLSNNGVLN